MGARLLHGTTLFRGCSACLLEEGTMCGAGRACLRGIGDDRGRGACTCANVSGENAVPQ